METIEKFQPGNTCHIVQFERGKKTLFISSPWDTGLGVRGRLVPRTAHSKRTTTITSSDEIIGYFEVDNLKQVDEILTRNISQ